MPAPAEFPPADKPRGVGVHPHRGFETVTIVYQGEVEHRDSTGSGGIIGPGDVQWMTAASGILHEEIHSRGVHAQGRHPRDGPALGQSPGQGQDAAPGYQTLLEAGHSGRQAAGRGGRAARDRRRLRRAPGPARTFTPINIWDIRLRRDGQTSLTLPEGHMVGVVVLRGAVLVNGSDIVREAQFALLDRKGGELTLEANDDVSALILSGEPIDEPVVVHGPFVMNTDDEIRQAMADFQSGRFGRIDA